MTLAEISSLGQVLTAILGRFTDCFAGTKGRALFRVFVCGLLSDVQRKNVEAIALRVQASVRTFQLPKVRVPFTGFIPNPPRKQGSERRVPRRLSTFELIPE